MIYKRETEAQQHTPPLSKSSYLGQGTVPTYILGSRNTYFGALSSPFKYLLML